MASMSMSDQTDAKGESKSNEDQTSEELESLIIGDAIDSIGGHTYNRSTGKLATMTESEFLAQHYIVKDIKFKGFAVIINNRNFEKRTGMHLHPRVGTDTDASQMKSLFEKIGFIVDRHDNVTADEMEQILQDVATRDHNKSSCFVCIILTHGEEGYVFGTDDRVSIDDLVAPLKGDKCSSLVGKPKIFLIQACRAPHVGFESDDGLGEMGIENDEKPDIKRIPTEADFLIALSVVPGCLVWNKSPQKSSWFIQAISDVFSKHWEKLDLMTMMTRVNRIVATEFETNAKKEFDHRKQQIPCITSMLIKDVYFFKK